jgi:AcrR family transcriptional regulator
VVQKRIGKPRAAAKPGAKNAAPDAEPMPKRRGRPRAYEPEVALGKALDQFRKDGFSATTLDDLSAATGMNRPSLYGAFGDKRDLYLKSYARYRANARNATAEIFQAALPIRQRLARIFGVALDIYLSGDDRPRGCFTVMTAGSEAIADPEIRAVVQDALSDTDRAFAASFRIARDNGELPENADPAILAQLASATLHSLALRARAGVPRKQLEVLVSGAIELICGGAK